MSTEENKSEVNAPYIITSVIKKHITLGYENSRKFLAIDLEAEDTEKQLFKKIGDELSTMIIGENEEPLKPTTYNDLVDVIKMYPSKRVFILTTQEHIRLHDLIEINEFVKNNNTIANYEYELRSPNWHSFVGIDYLKPFSYGLGMFTFSLDGKKREILLN